MLKKIMLTALSVGALIAFAAPAAQATVSLSDAGGALEPGAEVRATSVNLTTTQTGGSVLTCTSVALFFEVVANGPNHVELEEQKKAVTTGCKANGVLPVTIDNGGVTQNLTLNTWGTGNVGATFVSTVFHPTLDPEHKTPLSTCDYAGTLHVTPNGATGTDSIKVNKSALTAVACPEAHIEGTFTLETANNAPVSLNYTATP